MKRAAIAFNICLFLAALVAAPIAMVYALEHSPPWAISAALWALLAVTIWALAGIIASNH